MGRSALAFWLGYCWLGWLLCVVSGKTSSVIGRCLVGVDRDWELCVVGNGEFSDEFTGVAWLSGWGMRSQCGWSVWPSRGLPLRHRDGRVCVALPLLWVPKRLRWALVKWWCAGE